MKTIKSRFFSFHGCISRKYFLVNFLTVFILGLVISLIVELIREAISGEEFIQLIMVDKEYFIIFIITFFVLVSLSIALLVALLSSTLRRLNDIGWSPNYVILIIIPYLSLIFALILSLVPGKNVDSYEGKKK